ncbi:MAG TPA: PhzF family phenazine biosynthesis protein [Ktedonobacterales bacterium]
MASIMVPVVYTRVFGATPKGGNPCPVVGDADALTTEQMQGLAAQFGVETAFVLAPQHVGADLRLRYFVPLYEMEMCSRDGGRSNGAGAPAALANLDGQDRDAVGHSAGPLVAGG